MPCLCLPYPPSPLHRWMEVTPLSPHAAHHQPSLTAQCRTTGPSLQAVHNILTLLQLPCSLPGLAVPSTHRTNSTDNRKTALTAEEGSGSSLTGHQKDTLQNACLPDEWWAPTDCPLTTELLLYFVATLKPVARGTKQPILIWRSKCKQKMA